jgi:6-phosphofructokinase 1
MIRIGVMTSGGDAPGMNAAVRAVVRCGLEEGAEVYAIFEGYKGMIAGGDQIRSMDWNSVGGILHKGGTLIGTARCREFQAREGRLAAVQNLLEKEIDRLCVIGGDGSLTGANLLRQEWPDLVRELKETKRISAKVAAAHPHLIITGLVGSIDNDMVGTDITIGADTALHRIVEAVDAIASTAASHQRSFVIEVMGRRSGYLALMSALATGASWCLIPESPPDVDDWQAKMCEVLAAGRKAGRRQSMVILAEGATDRNGNEISADDVKRAIDERLQEDTRITVLGHVQRGGSPSAFDRNLSTQLGAAAVRELLDAQPEAPSYMLGLQENRIVRIPLMEAVEKTHAVNAALNARDYAKAMELRGRSYRESFRIMRTLVRALPHEPAPGKKRLRIGVMTASAPSPGMNTAVRAAVRSGLDKGHHMLAIANGFQGLIDGEIVEYNWMSVNGWVAMGGSELGTNRKAPHGRDLYTIARRIEEFEIDALLVVGGFSGYEAALNLYRERANYPAFALPIVCLPATINNNLPGTEHSVGADTALNSIVDAVGKIKQSAVASKRCFVVEVMGRYCGYLAFMSMLATGAERVYLHEEGVTLADLKRDLDMLVEGFSSGKRLGVMIRNERANPVYTTTFIADLFEEEGKDLFEVRWSVLGHLQQGGDPTPFDRVLATRYAVKCIERLEDLATRGASSASCIGLQKGHFDFMDFEDIGRTYDVVLQRPKDQWWMELRPLGRVLAQPEPDYFDSQSPGMLT